MTRRLLSVQPFPAIWALAGGALGLLILSLLVAFFGRGSAVRSNREEGLRWAAAHELGMKLAQGTGIPEDRAALLKLLDQKADPSGVAAALATVARTIGDEADEAFSQTVQASSLSKWVGQQLTSSDRLDQVDALEVVEMLGLQSLFGEAANLARSEDEEVSRAACDALVKLNPSVAVGVLIGLVERRGSWVMDSLGRAADELAKRTDRRVPISRPQWRGAPMLAEQALLSGEMPDPGSASDAVSVLIGLLEDVSSHKRLAAVNALANTINHPGAQIALVGALGSDDRLTRYAAASRMVETATGRALLHRVAESENNDAATVATEVLWAHDQEPTDADATSGEPEVPAITDVFLAEFGRSENEAVAAEALPLATDDDIDWLGAQEASA